MKRGPGDRGQVDKRWSHERTTWIRS